VSYFEIKTNMSTYQEKLFKAKADTLLLTLIAITGFNISMFYFFDVSTILNIKSSLFYQILVFNTIAIYILFQLFRKCNLINLIYRYQNAILANLLVFLSFQIWKKIYIGNSVNNFILIICIISTLLTFLQIKSILSTKK
jgi:hypothetical protein